MDYSIFKNDKEKAQAIIDIESLEASPGWQLVLKALDINEAHEDEKLHTMQSDKVTDFFLQQDIVAHLRKLKQLPRLLLEEARREDTAPQEDDSDPFDPPPATQPKQ